MRTPSQSSHQTNVKKKSRTKKRKQYLPSSFLDCQSLTHVVGFPPQHELITTLAVSDFAKDLFLERFVKEIVKPFQPDRNKKSEGAQEHDTTIANSDSGGGYYHVMVGGKLVKKRRISTSNQTSTAPQTEQSRVGDTIAINDSQARKRKIWKEHVIVGSNQCLRFLEASIANHGCNENPASEDSHAKSNEGKKGSLSPPQPSLIVLAKDVYPPTICSSVPAMARKLKLPLLLLPGKASLELGKAMNAKRVSVMILLSRDESNSSDDSDAKIMVDCGSDRKETREARTSIESFVSFIKDQMCASGGNVGT